MTGGGPQGITAGILEYISQSNGNMNMINPEHIFKWIDDGNFLEVVYLLSPGLSCFNAKK